MSIDEVSDLIELGRGVVTGTNVGSSSDSSSELVSIVMYQTRFERISLYSSSIDGSKAVEYSSSVRTMASASSWLGKEVRGPRWKYCRWMLSAVADASKRTALHVFVSLHRMLHSKSTILS